MDTLLDELTQNPMRSEAILLIVREAMDEGNPTLEHVATKTSRFGDSFDELSAEEFQVAHGMLSEAAPATDDAAPTMTRDEANAELKRRQEAHFAARKTRMIAEDDQRRCREAMATAIAEWSHSGGAYTQEMLARDTIRANQQHKLDVAEGRTVPTARNPRALRSRVDVEAYYRAGGDAATFTRKQFQRGSRRFGRGDVMNSDGRIVRVPSER